MEPLVITSVNNSKVKEIAGLALKKRRIESGLYVVEGLQLVGFGVENGWVLDTLVVQEFEKHPVLVQAQRVAKQVLVVGPAVMAKLSRKDNPQGVLGVFRQRRLPLGQLVPKAGELWIVLEQVRDPGNLGTIIRTVDAVGATGVILLGTCTDVWSAECVRATMGSIFHVPIVMAEVDEFLAWRRGVAGLMVGTHLQGAVDYRQVAKEWDAVRLPLWLAMGTEQSGLSEKLTQACDMRVKISMAGRAESLNLAMATGVLLYEVLRSKLPA